MVTQFVLLVLGIAATLLRLHGYWYIGISEACTGAMEYADSDKSCRPFGGYLNDMVEGAPMSVKKLEENHN